MRQSRCFALPFCLATSIAANAYAQVSAGLGGGGAMYAPQVSPFSSSLMFVGCDMTGIYRTTDSGATWRMVDTRDANTRQTMDPNGEAG